MAAMVPAQCPICGGELYAERLTCYECGTSLEGAFYLHRMARLTQEQWEFVELFLRCEGKLNAVQEDLGLSYPTVRNRLREVIRALGYEVGDESVEEDGERQTMLDDLAEGKTTVDQVLKLFRKRG